LANKNPIVQAMIPDPPPPPPKPAGGTSQKKKEPARAPTNYMEEIEMITRGSASPAGQRVQVIKQSGPSGPSGLRAMDYEPPASFLQTLDRPGPGREQKEGVIKGNVLAELWSM